MEYRNRIIAILTEFGALEWFGVAPPIGVPQDQLRYVPSVVWRFKSPNEDVESFICDLVARFPGSIRWQVSLESGRNWVLTPCRVFQIRDQQCLSDWNEAINRLAVIDPSFGKAANQEFQKLCDWIDKGRRDV